MDRYTDGQMYGWTDVQKLPRVQHDIVPFGAAAQKVETSLKTIKS